MKIAQNSIIKKESTEKTEKLNPTMILQNLLKDNNKKLKAVLGNNANSFMVSLVNLYNTDLNNADPATVINAAFVAAALKLPIEKNMGFAYIIPYKDKKKGTVTAQFQLGYKGLIQLALRSGGVRKLNAIPIYDGQIKSFNPLTEELELDLDSKISNEVIGYASYLELINGFNKTIYCNKKEIEEHAKKFSASYSYDLMWNKKTSVWTSQFDEMALKTMIKKILKFAPLSSEYKIAEVTDQSTIKKVDIDEETGEIILNQDDVNFSDSSNIEEIDTTEGEIIGKEKIDILMKEAHSINFDLLSEAKKIGIDITKEITDKDYAILENLIIEKKNKP